MPNLDPMVALLFSLFALAILAFVVGIIVMLARWVFRINKIVAELEAMRTALERLIDQDSPD